ncbi:replicative DNA helicase [Acrocarpospora phusangensis]|uniref:DNA 5'-3' helicase n=1 Tax=Acrocarpospora phusangensis TaxID=1070424 RepID=A0A919QE25_9ACTN|nr:replicative DNA helicase [Acrocarpospora phusangensis]GIH26034.1 replicative DNA helicase [Acrocarpospora phusangensis]
MTEASTGVEGFFEGWTAGPGVLAAEMAIAGAVIQSQACLEEAVTLLRPDDFYSRAGLVFAAAKAVLDDGRKVEPTAVLIELQDRGELARVGGGAYLHDLMPHAALPDSIGWCAREVREDADRRNTRAALGWGTQQTEEDRWDGDATLDLIRKRLDEVAAGRVGDLPPSVADDMVSLLEDLENPPEAVPGVVPPYLDLAALLTALRPGEVVVVGARPAIGKSTVATDLLRSAALRQAKRSVMFTLEMSRRDVLTRMVSAESQVPLKSIRDMQVSANDLDRVAEAGSRIAAAPLVIDDTPGCSIERIRTVLRTLSRSGPLGLVVVDYLQLMTPPKAESRQQEVSGLSREFKLLAKQFQVPLVLLSQLNRDPEKRSDRRPVIADLRESGAIEQDADIVILLHRDDAYDVECPRAGTADLIVAKNRNGPITTITVVNQLHYGKFADFAKVEEPRGRPDLRAVRTDPPKSSQPAPYRPWEANVGQ